MAGLELLSIGGTRGEKVAVSCLAVRRHSSGELIHLPEGRITPRMNMNIMLGEKFYA